MNNKLLWPLLAFCLLTACPGSVDTGQAGATSGSGGAPGTSAASTTGTSSTGGGADAGPADASPDAEPCPPGVEPTRCAEGCAVQDGGACVCDPDQAPNCPAGWWKVCCAGGGAPCAPPVIDAAVIPACGPGPAPAWCVSYPLSCE